MKKYILFTNTKEKYHAHSLEFSSFYFLWKHLQEEFYFEKWDYDSIIKDYNTYIEDNIADWVFEYSLKLFLEDVFDVANNVDIETFEKICMGECMILSTYNESRYSFVIDNKDFSNKTDYLIMVFNMLLSAHGTTTSPVGVVNVYEIVAVEENIEGQEELDLPF